MRISDWSSDVCSSDLAVLDCAQVATQIVDGGQGVVDGGQRIGRGLADRLAFVDGGGGRGAGRSRGGAGGSVGDLHVSGKVGRRASAVRALDEPVAVVILEQIGFIVGRGCTVGVLERQAASGDRSEEHKSELQSLMRISYA